MKEAYLCLGGNMGNTITLFTEAIDILRSKSITITCKSGIYSSAAWGMENASDFLNQVIGVATDLSAHDLMQLLLQVEKQLGRKREHTGKYESRTLDIDIILFNDEIINEEHLHIPHPRMHLRRFVLEPLAEIAPKLIHPAFHKTIEQLLKECPDTGHIKRLSHVA